MRNVSAILLSLICLIAFGATSTSAEEEGGIRFQSMQMLNAENLREVEKLPLGKRAALRVEFLPMIGTAPSWFDHALKIRGPEDYRRTIKRTSVGGSGRHTLEWLLPQDAFPEPGEYVLVLMINGDFSDPLDLKITEGDGGDIHYPDNVEIKILTPEGDAGVSMGVDTETEKETSSYRDSETRRTDRFWVKFEINDGRGHGKPWNEPKARAHWFIEDAGDEQWVLSDDFACRIKVPKDWEVVEGSSPGWMSRLTLRPEGEDTTLHWLVRPLYGAENRKAIRSSYEKSSRFRARDVEEWGADDDRVDSSTALIVDYDPKEGFGDMNAAYFMHEGYAMVFEGVAGEDGFVSSESIFEDALEGIRLD